MQEFSSRQVSIQDHFWSPRLETNARSAILHQWEQLEASGCIDNFRILAGQQEGFRAAPHLTEVAARPSPQPPCPSGEGGERGEIWGFAAQSDAKPQISPSFPDPLGAGVGVEETTTFKGGVTGFREGWYFADSDAYKWLDAAARSYALDPDAKLAAGMEALLALLLKARASDGYLFTYNQIHFPGVRWVNLQIEHELYCHGHLIEACLSHQLATGRGDSLALARSAADLLVRDFMGKGPAGTPGHEEIEIALLRLYQVTGHTPYLELAAHFLEQRGRKRHFALALLRQNASSTKRGKFVEKQRRRYLSAHPEHASFHLPARNAARSSWLVSLRWFASVLTGKYFQQHAPVRAQSVPVGHAVRFAYLQTASALLERLRPDPDRLPALEQSWEHMVTRRMYVTGGIGSLPVLEGFGNDYELDPAYAYAETCAALGSLFWNWEMALTTGKARYSDLFEWQLYNAAAVGMGLDGQGYLYNNPLACRGGLTRQAWFDIPCCPSNLSRTWASLGKYIYSMDDQNLWIHQYIGSQLKAESGGLLELRLDSGLPYGGHAALRLTPRSRAAFTLHVRLPSWSAATRVTVNAQPLDVPAAGMEGEAAAGGYDPRKAQFLPIRRAWSEGDLVEIDFDLAISLRRASPRVRGHGGKVAVTRGPLVYCLESVDNPGVDLFKGRLDPATLRVEPAPGLLGGIQVLRAATVDGKPLTFIPYSLWANRGPSQMTVWVRT